MGGQDGGRSHTDRSTPRKRRPLSPSTLYAYAILALTIAILSILLGLSYIPALCPDRHMHSGYIDAFCQDQHYRYLVPLMLPVTSWFVIANWVGWEYFRYA